MWCVKYLEMRMNKAFRSLSVVLLSFSAQYAYAECEVYASPAVLGPVSSFEVPNLPSQQMSGGLACYGTLTLATTSYIKYRPINAPTMLVHENGVNTARIVIRDSSNNIVQTGVEKDLSSFSLISIFGGPNSSIPFSVALSESVNLKPGTYTGNLDIKWFYYVGAFGIGGISLWDYRSPGLVYSWVWGITNWGTGRDATVPIKLIVKEDCRINAYNVDLGSAALVSKFDTASGMVQIICSAQTPYSVGLSDGQNFDTTRRLKHQSKNNYIAYDIYKNFSPQRWGSEGAERWNSTDASIYPGVHDGTTRQTYSFTTKIIEPSTTIAPEGVYTDTLQVEVRF